MSIALFRTGVSPVPIASAGARLAARLCLALALLPCAATSAPQHVEVAERQRLALDITTKPPKPATETRLAALAARVVVPPGQLHQVSAPLAGSLSEVLIATGQTVRRGQVLFRLSSPALAELRRSAAQAGIQREQAERNARRDQQLFDEGLISESRHRASQSALAEARLQSAERREALRLAGAESDAKLQTGLAVRSPIDGIVLELLASPSARVEAAAPLARVARIPPLWLEIEMPVVQAARVPIGARVLRPADPPGTPALAIVQSFAAEVADATQTVRARALVGESGSGLRPGQFLSVDLVFEPAGASAAAASGASVPASVGGSAPAAGATVPARWRLPAAALARIDDGTFLFVRDRDGFRLVPARLQDSFGEEVIVEAALAADASIAVTGVSSLKAIAAGIGAVGKP